MDVLGTCCPQRKKRKRVDDAQKCPIWSAFRGFCFFVVFVVSPYEQWNSVKSDIYIKTMWICT